MRRFSPCLLLIGALLLWSCGPKPTSIEDFSTLPVTLPGGQVIRAETMYSNVDLLRGLMYRNSLAPDHGMLFFYPRPDHYQTVMYNVLIPLDIIWMDSRRDIIQIDANAPPCKTQASKCTKYGGKFSLFALEIAGGTAAKYGLQVGQRIQW
jgi:uncharacterized membrane protein (UPF0127 family)